MWILIGVVFAIYAVADFLDCAISDAGIKSGVAVEGNTLIVWLDGTNKPGTKTYVLYGLGEALVLSAPAIFGLATANPYVAIISIGPWDSNDYQTSHCISEMVGSRRFPLAHFRDGDIRLPSRHLRSSYS
jgi:hypothetical protein